MNEIVTFGGKVTDADGRTADENIEALIAMVGERVRVARARKGISRRILSEMSGVSQRYLAQLEAGQGNPGSGGDGRGARVRRLVPLR